MLGGNGDQAFQPWSWRWFGKASGEHHWSMDTESALYGDRKGSSPDTTKLDLHVAPAQAHAQALAMCCLMGALLLPLWRRK